MNERWQVMTDPQCRAADRDGQRCVLFDGHDSPHSAGNALAMAERRVQHLEARIARVRDICQHANDNWLDDEELPIKPEHILAELEEAPAF